jgi:hypothetical protein
MNRLVKMLLLAVVVLALFGASYRYVTAQDEHTQRGSAPLSTLSVPVPTLPPALAPNHVLQRTYFTAGDLNSMPFPAGTQTAVDAPQTITCPGTSGTCTISADIWVETGNTTTNGSPNNFAVCAEVDGGDLSGGCFYAANTPDDGSFVTGTRSDSNGGYTHGNHTVQTFLFTNNGAPVQKFNVTYRVYKP